MFVRKYNSQTNVKTFKCPPYKNPYRHEPKLVSMNLVFKLRNRELDIRKMLKSPIFVDSIPKHCFITLNSLCDVFAYNRNMRHVLLYVTTCGRFIITLEHTISLNRFNIIVWFYKFKNKMVLLKIFPLDLFNFCLTDIDEYNTIRILQWPKNINSIIFMLHDYCEHKVYSTVIFFLPSIKKCHVCVRGLTCIEHNISIVVWDRCFANLYLKIPQCLVYFNNERIYVLRYRHTTDTILEEKLKTIPVRQFRSVFDPIMYGSDAEYWIESKLNLFNSKTLNKSVFSENPFRYASEKDSSYTVNASYICFSVRGYRGNELQPENNKAIINKVWNSPYLEVMYSVMNLVQFATYVVEFVSVIQNMPLIRYTKHSFRTLYIYPFTYVMIITGIVCYAIPDIIKKEKKKEYIASVTFSWNFKEKLIQILKLEPNFDQCISFREYHTIFNNVASVKPFKKFEPLTLKLRSSCYVPYSNKQHIMADYRNCVVFLE